MQSVQSVEDDGWSQEWSSEEDQGEGPSGSGMPAPWQGVSSGSELIVDQSGYEREDEEVRALAGSASAMQTPHRKRRRRSDVTQNGTSSSIKLEESEASFALRPTPPRFGSPRSAAGTSRRVGTPSAAGRSSSSALGTRSPYSGRKSPLSARPGRRRDDGSGSSRPATPTPASPRTSKSLRMSVDNALVVVFDALLAVFSVPFRVLGVAISPFSTVLYGSVFVAVLASLLYTSISSPLAALASRLSSLASFRSVPSFPLNALIQPTKLLASYSAAPLTFVTCSLLPGLSLPFCPPPKPLLSFPVAQIARSISQSARQASDIFESVVELGDPGRLGLHQAEIWELGVAIKTSPGVEGREALAAEISDLGLLTRDVKDSMITINSLGINAFSFIVHEFKRIEDLLHLIHSGSRQYSSDVVAQNLDLLFSRLSADLTSLLALIDLAIPQATRASNLGGRVMESLAFEHARLKQVKETTPLWDRLVAVAGTKGGFRNRQLARDLELTGVSVVNLKNTRTKLEDARSALVAYRNNAELFKSSLVGWHIADHGLTAEDEIFALRRIMATFATTVDTAKTAGSVAIRRELAEREADRLRVAEAIVEGGPEVARW